MTHPPVSVIVVLHNGARYIERCLSSVFESSPEAEVVVVDNNSTDGGLEQAVRRFPSVIPLRSGLNLGYAGGVNLGLTVASASMIAPLNQDTEVAVGCLDLLLDHLAQHPKVGAVTPLILIDQKRQTINAMGGAIYPFGLSSCHRMGEPADGAPKEPFSVPGVSGASFVIRRHLLEAMGGAPAFCFMGNDDVVLSWTLRLMGHDIHCVPSARVYHRYNLSLDSDKLYYLERNRWIHLATALEGATLFKAAPGLAALEGAVLAYCALKGPRMVAAKLRAMRHAISRPAFLSARRQHLAQLRAVGDRELFDQLAPSLPWGQLLSLMGRVSERQESV